MPTTTEYGGWGRYTNRDTVEDTVADYLGEFTDDYDVEGLADAVRDAINEQLSDANISLRGPEFYGPYPHTEDAGEKIQAAIEAVDLGALAEKFERTVQ